jgi:hypothetical protein
MFDKLPLHTFVFPYSVFNFADFKNKVTILCHLLFWSRIASRSANEGKSELGDDHQPVREIRQFLAVGRRLSGIVRSVQFFVLGRLLVSLHSIMIKSVLRELDGDPVSICVCNERPYAVVVFI